MTKRANEEKDQDVLAQLCEHFNKFLSGEDVNNLYDLCIFDTPPGKTFITMPVLRAATDCLIPTSAGQFDIDGVYEMMSVLETENQHRTSAIKLSGIIPNKVRKIIKHQDKLKILREGEITGRFVYQEQLSERAAFIFDKMPLGGNQGYKYADEKAETEISAVIEKIRENVWADELEEQYA